MSNKMVLQACAFLVLSLASGWIYLNSLSFKDVAVNTADDFKIDMKSPAAVKEAVTKAESQIQEVDQRMTDLKHEMKALDEQRAFLTRFIQTFAFSATNRSPANEAFHELPEEVQEVLKEVEAQIGRSLVDFKQPSADSLEALYDGEVLVQTGRGGRPIVPENIADAFYEINGALGGVSAIKTIVIAAGADFEPQKTRIKRFVKDYLGHSGAQGIEIREVPADEGIKLSVEMFPVLFGSRSRH